MTQLLDLLAWLDAVPEIIKLLILFALVITVVKLSVRTRYDTALPQREEAKPVRRYPHMWG